MDTRVFGMEEYAKLLDTTFDNIKQLGKLKGGEYSGDVDRLENFRRNGHDNDLPYTSIWRVYAGKHWDAITQYVKDIKNGKQRERMESLAGRCDDLILYLILFKAMVIEQERLKAAKETPPPRSNVTGQHEDEYTRAMNNARGDL